MATDSRATAGNWIASQTVKKVIEINSTLLGTMAGGAAVSLDAEPYPRPSRLALVQPTSLRRANAAYRIASTGLHTLASSVAYTNSVTNAAFLSPQPRRSLQTWSILTKGWVYLWEP